jgi:hypothetical protein
MNALQIKAIEEVVGILKEYDEIYDFYIKKELKEKGISDDVLEKIKLEEYSKRMSLNSRRVSQSKKWLEKVLESENKK